MARVGNVPTVSAYKGNIGQQLMRVGNTLDDISQDYKKKQEVELAQAKKLYTQGLNINLYNSINELRNNPNLSANPQGLASAMDEVLNKTLQDVDDNDVKMAVMVDYQLKKNTYVNHAQTEFDRVQRAKAKSYAYDSVYANIDSMGASFANAFTGNMTEDDIANFQHSLANIKANINATNPDGTYVFTDAQRRSMAKEADQYPVKAFEVMYDDLSQEQKDSIRNAINNGGMDIIQTEQGSIGLRDVVGDDNFSEIRKFVNEEEYKRVSLENKRVRTEKMARDIEQYDNEVNLSNQLDNMELRDALRTLDENQNNVSDKYYKAKQKAILSANNVNPTTQAEAYTDLLMQAQSIANADTAEEKIKISRDVLANIEKVSAEGNLKPADKKRLIERVQSSQLKALPDYIKEKDTWFGYDYANAKKDFESSLFNKGKTASAMLKYDQVLSDKKLNSQEKKKLVKSLIDEYNNTGLDEAVKEYSPSIVGEEISGQHQSVLDRAVKTMPVEEKKKAISYTEFF